MTPLSVSSRKVCCVMRQIRNREVNPLTTPNDHCMGHTAQLTSRRCILYIYSTNKRTEYFKHAA